MGASVPLVLPLNRIIPHAKPQLWSDKRLAYLGGCYPYDLAPDGKRFAVVLNPDTANQEARKPTDHIMVLPDFFDELRRKVPAGNI